jgi:4a-hydroxytetrahydrobiopterin dehydratase
MAAQPLSGAVLDAVLASLPGWTHEAGALCRAWRFPDFATAMAFLGDCVADIERLDHHPDWRNAYDRVWVRLSTHDAGSRVTALDSELAKIMAWKASALGGA